MRTVLVTHATEYAGPGAVGALLRGGCQVLCHDPSFASEAKRKAYEAENAGASALAGQEVSDFFNEVRAGPQILMPRSSTTFIPIARVPSKRLASMSCGRPSRHFSLCRSSYRNCCCPS